MAHHDFPSYLQYHCTRQFYRSLHFRKTHQYPNTHALLYPSERRRTKLDGPSPTHPITLQVLNVLTSTFRVLCRREIGFSAWIRPPGANWYSWSVLASP